MQKLTVHNPKYLSYTSQNDKEERITIDILGGVDLINLDRLVATLRIGYGNYPMYRQTIDLYSESQIDKLLRKLCDRFELKLLEVSRSIHDMILSLEKYRLQNVQYSQAYEVESYKPNKESAEQAIKTLKSKTLTKQIIENFNKLGIIGEDENILTLTIAMASHKYSNPFSVLCVAKAGIGKSYIIHQLSSCIAEEDCRYHNEITPTALYYSQSRDINNKVLFIEDVEWTKKMLKALSGLQSNQRLVTTRATKDKDGMFHASSFEINSKLCMIGCTDQDRSNYGLTLPFLHLQLNESKDQDKAIMEYQKKRKAGLVSTDEIEQARHQIKCLVSCLENIKIINPYAPLIELPKDVSHPRKTLWLLLNFIEVVTYFFQHQRKQYADSDTGEVFIKTHPDDIELAYKLLKHNLFRRADELSTAARKFYHWLGQYLKEAQVREFKAIDIRKAKTIHPRTLNRYLSELRYYSYLTVSGGNKHRDGYSYKLTELSSHSDARARIDKELKENLKKIRQVNRKKIHQSMD